MFNTRFSFYPLLIALAGLLLYACGFAATRLFVTAAPPMIPISIWTPIVIAVISYRMSSKVRIYAKNIPIPLLLIIQAVRAPIGIFFLVQESRGILPSAFASPAGWGDLVYGLGAAGLFVFWRSVAKKKTLLWAWNWVGLVDILLVNIAAMRIVLFSDSPLAFRSEMGVLPTAIIPLFVVPIVISMHILLFVQLRNRA